MKITEKLKATLRKMLSLQLGEVATKDGKKLYWSSEEDLREGLEVFVDDENGELIPAPNGVYETEDNKKIEVEDGVVKDIEDPEAEVAPENENLADPAAEPAAEPAADPAEDKPAEPQTRMSRMDILKNLK